MAKPTFKQFLVNENIFDVLIPAASGMIIAKAIGPWLDKVDRKINNLEFMKRRRKHEQAVWEIKDLRKDIARLEKRLSKLKTNRNTQHYRDLIQKRKERIEELSAEFDLK